MDKVILRFPHLNEKIFAQLDNLSLKRSREVSRPWKLFIDHQKFPHIRSIQLYIQEKHEITEPWRNFLKMSNTEMIMLLNSAVKEVYTKKDFWKEMHILNPLHVAAIWGKKCLYQYIEERLGDKNPKCNLGFTPFHFAAEYGHLDLSKHLSKNL